MEADGARENQSAAQQGSGREEEELAQEHEEKLTGARGHGQQVREGELAQEHEEVIELAGEQR